MKSGKDFKTRPAIMSDIDEMFECYTKTMRHYVEPVWGWDPEQQRQGFMRALNFESTEVIEVDGDFAGFVWLQHLPDGAMLRLICLEQCYQRLGIGSKLLAALAVQVQGLRLKVFKANPAIDLYRRLGFVQVTENDYMVEMVYAK